MSDLLVVVLNGKITVKYEKNKPLAGLQRRFLENMDNDMDQGIKINAELISAPDKMQRVQYVTNYLVNSVLKNKQQLIATSCAYIAKALPDLKQIRIDTSAEHDSIDLIFSEELKNQVSVDFP